MTTPTAAVALLTLSIILIDACCTALCPSMHRPVVVRKAGWLDERQQTSVKRREHSHNQLSSSLSSSEMSSDLNQALQLYSSNYIHTCKVQVGPSTACGRLGLIATEMVGKDQVALAIPYDDNFVLTPQRAFDTALVPKEYKGWTGDEGLLSLVLLSEFASLQEKQPSILTAWLSSLPSRSELRHHPLLWPPEFQEVLQNSSTKKIYHQLDDIEQDATWLQQHVWSLDRARFPEYISSPNKNEEKSPCFCPEGFQYAMALVLSRAVYVDEMLRLVPIMDYANHADRNTVEILGGKVGPFFRSKNGVAQLRTGNITHKKGDEIFCNYGPKRSAAEYLIQYGFLPRQALATKGASCEVSFELNPDDRFHDDKLDILMYDSSPSPMSHVQKFDITEDEPDPVMMQFLRLVHLGGTDAFLLESIFRKEVWDFMASPVSEANERLMVETIIDVCTRALADMLPDDDTDNDGPLAICAALRKAERRALTRMLEYMTREKESLDLKEYYQERRLKDLGLDSAWNEEEDNEDVGFGQRRAPGSVDW